MPTTPRCHHCRNWPVRWALRSSSSPLRKMVGDDPFDMISGTTGLTGAVDTAFVLHRGQQGVTLRWRRPEIEEMEQAVEFVGGMWKVLGDAAEVRRSEERSAIREILDGTAEPPGRRKLPTHWVNPRTTSSNCCSRCTRMAKSRNRDAVGTALPDFGNVTKRPPNFGNLITNGLAQMTFRVTEVIALGSSTG